MVDISSGFSCQIKIVGEKDIMFPCLRIPVTNPTKRNRALTGFCASEDNGLVRVYPLGFKNPVALSNLILDVALEESDEKIFFSLSVYSHAKSI